ncbi:MAG: hypothetical protein RL213_1821 [Bacteroidota bacterium]
MEKLIQEKTTCYHCGDVCTNVLLKFDDKDFCCEGCRLVYDVLQENDLCTYYRFNSSPGISPPSGATGRFGYLDDPGVRRRLIDFEEGGYSAVTFHIPKMHCSSCIWLLENLHRINPGVTRSRVDFLAKEANLVFRQEAVSLRQLVELLSLIGYEPVIRLDSLEKGGKKKTDRTQVYKIGVAGFAFGNIMLFSFPEYLSLSDATDPGFKGVFSYLNFALSLPVLFYCSTQFFRSAWQSIHQRFLNIDVPIALGILVMFVRSSYDIFTASGAGYMDTMAGLVFFMLIGRWFQDKTYRTLSFERDYTSFFPVSVMLRKGDSEESIPLSALRTGDRILVRNEEVIPADAVLLKGEASVDYSFVTGESAPVSKKPGDLIFAGGRQQGALLELEVVKDVSQSYLTQLWNNDRYLKKQDDSGFQSLVNRISHYFTFVIVGVSLLSLGWWLFHGDAARAWDAFTAVLIIACPCALAISSPFTLGNILRIFGKQRFYLRGYPVVEKLARVDTVVFDKTGTLNFADKADGVFEGAPLSEEEKRMVAAVVVHSSHPLSRLVYSCLDVRQRPEAIAFEEHPGKGVSAEVFGFPVRLGSASFVAPDSFIPAAGSTEVHLSVNGLRRGRFVIGNSYRPGVEDLVSKLRGKGYSTVVLSGDNATEERRLREMLGENAIIRFRQSPADKLEAIQELQAAGANVLMVGDGLNDAGALKQADVGISVSDDINNFSPACDGILDGRRFSSLSGILRTAVYSRWIILGSFGLALVYNVIGCWFAVQGALSPVIAAILMPLSTATIIAFTTGMSNLVALKGGKSAV